MHPWPRPMNIIFKGVFCEMGLSLSLQLILKKYYLKSYLLSLSEVQIIFMRVCILVFVDCIYMDIVLLHGHCTISFKCDNAFCMSIYCVHKKYTATECLA